MQCYRFKGHSVSDPRKYRTHDEEQHWETEDPIGKLVSQLYATDVLDRDQVKALSKTVRGEIKAAVEWAKASPEPHLDELFHDVYVEQWGPYTGTSLPEFMQRRSSDGGGQH
jgi:pyruvate dehydrogenase E1 component alpha subunit